MNFRKIIFIILGETHDNLETGSYIGFVWKLILFFWLVVRNVLFGHIIFYRYKRRKQRNKERQICHPQVKNSSDIAFIHVPSSFLHILATRKSWRFYLMFRWVFPLTLHNAILRIHNTKQLFARHIQLIWNIAISRTIFNPKLKRSSRSQA